MFLQCEEEMSGNYKSMLEIGAFIISVIALVVSFISIGQSKKANKLSEEANLISKATYAADNQNGLSFTSEGYVATTNGNIKKGTLIPSIQFFLIINGVKTGSYIITDYYGKESYPLLNDGFFMIRRQDADKNAYERFCEAIKKETGEDENNILIGLKEYFMFEYADPVSGNNTIQEYFLSSGDTFLNADIPNCTGVISLHDEETWNAVIAEVRQ